MNYEIATIQSNVSTPFHLVLEDGKASSKEIRKNRIYNLSLTKFVTKLLSFYKYKTGLVVDYLPICYFSLYATLLGYKTLYVNSNRKYQKYIDYSCILNNIDNMQYIPNWRHVNSFVKDKHIILQICDRFDFAINSKRLITKNKVDNIILLRNDAFYDFDNFSVTMLYLIKNAYALYKINKDDTITAFDNWREGWKDYQPIVAVHTSSKYRSGCTVYFD